LIHASYVDIIELTEKLKLLTH